MNVRMNLNKYLIIAEIERKGFLLDSTDNLVEAGTFAELVFHLSDEFSIYEMHLVERKLNYFASYNINGTEVYVGKSLRSISNGVYSVSILKIDPATFSLEIFIKERENHSTVFDYDVYPDEIDRLAEIFPNPDFIAN
jgi:hypothetical protein